MVHIGAINIKVMRSCNLKLWTQVVDEEEEFAVSHGSNDKNRKIECVAEKMAL